MLGSRFRSMNSNNLEISPVKRFLPTPVPGVIADAIDSSKGPKVDRDDLAFYGGQ